MIASSPLRHSVTRGSALLLLSFLLIVACDGGSGSPTAPPAPEKCEGYPPWASSDYVLPYPVGESHMVIQGNCTGGGHNGFHRYGYDFGTAIGEVVTAARDGVVLDLVEGLEDGEGNFNPDSTSNHLTIEHADGTVALYAHLTKNGVLVEEGDFVMAGDRIGLTGNSGWTAGIPHLHFSVHVCNISRVFCPSVPVTFRNTTANPVGLDANQVYAAGPF